MNVAFVYNGPGASALCVKELSSALEKESYVVTALGVEALKRGEWCSSAALFVMPGGRDVPYNKELAGEGNAIIKKWVNGGGAFLGICAGAYYGSGYVEFESGSDIEVRGSRELAFFPGTARGSAYSDKRFSYGSESGAHISKLTWKLQDCHLPEVVVAYFNGGCTFVDVESYRDISILAVYQDLEGAPPAIIECVVGKGKAILSGVHPEFSELAVEDPLKQAIIQGDAGRYQLFQTLIRRLVPHTDY